MTTDNVSGTGTIDFTAWTKATGDLNWGVQRTLYETLKAAAEGKATLVYGADSYAGRPCLINAVANMISVDVNKVSPMSWFPAVVSEFDRINNLLRMRGVNTDHFVSETAAEVLLANFGTLKPAPTEEEYAEVAAETLRATLEAQPYHEPSDAEFADMLAASADHVPPVDVVDEPVPFADGSNVRVFRSNA